MNIEIPEALSIRIQSFCEKNAIDTKEFIFDAIVEKLERAHMEKRKKPRM